MRSYVFLICVCFISFGHSEYYLIDDYNSETFLDLFDFYTEEDPGWGFVEFVNHETAVREGLFKINKNKTIYIGVDSTNIVNEDLGDRGRKSVRLHSKKHYTHGLFILDLGHMPGDACGTWLGFWLMHTLVRNPMYGQMNIIEGSDSQIFNVPSIRSVHDCYIDSSSDGFTGKLIDSNCNYQNGMGCKVIDDKNRNNYGKGFNDVGGGVYATQWTSQGVRIWHFVRDNIPKDITTGEPNPDSWGIPVAKYTGGNCSYDVEFRDHFIVITTTFCGSGWFGFWDDTPDDDPDKKYCQKTYGDGDNVCKDFVRSSYWHFTNSYWLINSLKVYSETKSPTVVPKHTTLQAINSTQTTQTTKSSTVFPVHKSSFHWIYLAIFLPILAILIILCAVFFWCRYKRRERLDAIYALARNGLKLFSNDLVKQKLDENLWEIRRENVVIQSDSKLGSGAFADVYKAQLIGEPAIKNVYSHMPGLSKFCDCDVAVKVLPPFASEAAKIDLQKEINFMKSLKFHQHLVCLLGCVSNTISPMLVLEYCANFDLLQFLQKNKNNIIYVNEQEGLRLKSLVMFAWQIADGLHYLTNLGLIHRDVAARNILVDKDYVCKIGDFGLCRLTTNEIYASRGGKLPIRWMSIESLKRSEFSMKTDVYNLMLNCWQFEPCDRPTFAQISQLLTRLIESNNCEYNYIETIPLSEFMLPKSN